MYKIAYAPKPPEKRHNIALEMAKAILKAKLALLEEGGAVGNNGDGMEIEYITRIEDAPGGGWRFLVKTWSGLSSSPDQTKVMGFAELSDLICRVANNGNSAFEYARNLPIVPERDARKDSK